MKTPTLKPARIGSISHGTLRTEDLLSTFISEMEGLILLSGDFLSLPENHSLRNRLNNLIGGAQNCFGDDGETIQEDKEDDAAELVNESFPEAFSQYFARSYCYFGTHEGDGSDFGFWPSWDSINELPTVEDADAAIELGEDCKAVNDHGNVTVFSGDGTAVLELV